MKRLKKAVNIKDELGIDSIGESTRDCAGLYFDGKIWTGNTHSEILQKIQTKYKDSNLDYYDDQFAFLHMKKVNGKMCAFIEETTPIPFTEIANAVKQKYPNASVYSRSLSNGKEVQKVAKRLIKKAFMDIDVLQGAIDELSNDGRDILKAIEDYKFKLEQAARIVANDPILTQKIVQKRKVIDGAMSQIYGIVFDLENMDITQLYQNQQMLVNNPGMSMPNPDGEPVNVGPGAAPVPPAAPAPGAENGEGSEEDAIPSGGGAPDGGASSPSSEESEDGSTDDEDTEDEGEDLKEEDLPEEPEETK